MRVQANQPTDGSYKPISSGLPFMVKKQRVFIGAAGLGAQGATTLFTVTGTVMVRLVAACTEDLVGAGTIESGISGNTAGLLAQIADATTLDAGESWVDASPATLEGVDLSNGIIIANGQDIIETIGAADITDGTLTYYLFWRPLSDDGLVEAA